MRDGLWLGGSRDDKRAGAARGSGIGRDCPHTHSTRPCTVQEVNMRTKERVSAKDFDLLRMLGQGSFGKVFLVRKVTGPDAKTL